ncbi:unnamed protein product [Rhizoctonia solani]|uniref:Uncharacterized protein n=1 Tax=Rhizoctonia solani TaxID=456999 RepID=A0A8H3BAE6_9AGAM|nr:unnamed protein product [Rhizoctonia solani]
MIGNATCHFALIQITTSRYTTNSDSENVARSHAFDINYITRPRGGFYGVYRVPVELTIPAYKPTWELRGNRHFCDSPKTEQGPSVGLPSNRGPSVGTLKTGRDSGDSAEERKKDKNEKDSKNEDKSKVKRKKKFKGKNKPNKGNKHIVAALAGAINKDDWPNISRHSTLDPQNLEGWHPDESEWLAGHRLGMALSVLTENQWDRVQDSEGVISTQKLAQVLAKKHMGQVDHLPDLDDPEEIQFYKNWGSPLPFGYDFDTVWLEPSGPSKSRKTGNPGKPDESRPDSA